MTNLNSAVVGRVLSIMQNFVVQIRDDLLLEQTQQDFRFLKTTEKTLAYNSRHLQQKTAKFLTFSELESYSRIVPRDVVEKPSYPR